ncbi:Chromosome II, complete genome, related [Eimeria mitis]|uniref:Chromosome II, complete genome, related n=1 Tax=Eimeria mitis TaxID=44415 RepID=U6K4T0_9EIME|nr:Chromosome II, complete genome, related [Eimeria mitis]CDJ32699.1 Chromosome II, complete genome, related [Eimeria mitis]
MYYIDTVIVSGILEAGTWKARQLVKSAILGIRADDPSGGKAIGVDKNVERLSSLHILWNFIPPTTCCKLDRVEHHGEGRAHYLARKLLDSLPPYDAIDERNRDFTIETLRQVAEVLVWGEHNNRGYFDVFCEQNVLSYFVQLAEQPTVPNAVKVQLLQTLSIIVQSINKETAVYYMFSNNYINSLLSTKFDFDDEEVASWYVSFIKSLSLLVNADTIKLFLNERAKHFPIYSESVKFFRAKDSMVLQDLSLRAFLIERPIFFSHVACYLRELVDGQLLRLTTNRDASPDRCIQDGVLEIEEMLFYVQDIFSLGVEEFSELLAARLMLHCYLPLIGMLGMHVNTKWERDHSNSVKTESSKHDSRDVCLQLPGNGDEHCGTGSPRKTTDGDGLSQEEKRLEQGWMWGWSTPEDLQDPKRRHLMYVSRDAGVVAAQSGIFVGYVGTRIPKPLYDLIVAKAPAMPEAYKNLRNPSECAGNIDTFLPTQELPSSGESREVTSEGSNVRKETSDTSIGTSEARLAPTGDHSKVHSALSFEDRIRMLKISMDALLTLGYFEVLDDIDGARSRDEARQPKEPCRTSPDGDSNACLHPAEWGSFTEQQCIRDVGLWRDRMALSVLITLITEHILKFQSSEYRTSCLKVLANKVLKLRRAAAVATKLCLSALSDGHTIDVFWDEWEVHRLGAITDSAFARDFRILLSPRSSQTESKASAFPPYLLVATTDQEIERRSIQVFLLLRRLHRDLSAILQSIRATPNDATAVAQKASSILNGISVEPNPLESEDNAEQYSHVDESKTLEKDATPS